MILVTSLPDTEGCGPAKDKYGQNILKPLNHDMNSYTTDELFEQDDANVLNLN